MGLNVEFKAQRPFDTSVTIYRSTQHNVPEDLNLQQYRCKKTKRRTLVFLSPTDEHGLVMTHVF
jgi:hypothetical protein